MGDIIKREYDANGNETYYEDSNGYWDKSEYDENGNRTYFENSLGEWSKSEYDNGKCAYFENSNGDWYRREYDDRGNCTCYETSEGYWAKYEYDANGNVTFYETSDGAWFKHNDTNNVLLKGWKWHDYDDLSGCLVSPNGKEYFHYDMCTGEYKVTKEKSYDYFVEENYATGGYSIGSIRDFKNFAENYIVEHILDLDTITKTILEEYTLEELKNDYTFISCVDEIKQQYAIKHGWILEDVAYWDENDKRLYEAECYAYNRIEEYKQELNKDTVEKEDIDI